MRTPYAGTIPYERIPFPGQCTGLLRWGAAYVDCWLEDNHRIYLERDKPKQEYRDRYQLIGTTLGGRRLKIIFQLKPKNIVRIITGWPL